ncbi:tetratricopeptide repeat protein [Streptomyces sp. NBC_00984]|uniref:AfsR/SARP family transcriptional regulator n=1 Tax=Streptomyces sp. NBC_00984 TaxID=2903700 RepID=UPI003868B60F|nr:tetratricopeptide repeat protein [Streptomyces sp. NBC_00984]
MLTVKLLGMVGIDTVGGFVTAGPGKQSCVFAALAVHPGQLLTPETLIDRVWGDQAPLAVRSALFAYISRLRRTLANSGDPAIELRRAGAGYALVVEPGSVDLHRMRHLRSEGRKAAGQQDHAAAARLFREAAGLWNGEALSSVAGDWAARVRLGIDQERLLLLGELFDSELQLARHQEIVHELANLVAEHPLDEPLAARFILALHRSGRTNEALAHYRRTRRHLNDELGADPGPVLQQLHQQMLSSTSAPPTSAAPRGATPPDHADQWNLPQPGHLPRAAAGFVGRDQELAALGAELKAVEPMLTRISGMAGIGKTTLAVHWAHQARRHFPDGQLFVDLRGYGPGRPLRPLEVLARFLVSLGVPPDRVPTEEEQAAALFRSAVVDQRLLVVLDNAHSTEQVRPLLPGSSGVSVLVTSRNRLIGLGAREGANELQLGVFSEAEAVELIQRVVGEKQAPRAGQAGTTAAAELARLCGRLPLAVRIAAAQAASTPAISLDFHVARLADGDRLAKLAVRGDEQMAVRAAFDHSYAALDLELQRLFRLLGLLPFADFPAQLADALVADANPDFSSRILSRAEPLLQRLADAHLVNRSADNRYFLHDLLRQYAHDLALAKEPKGERAAAIRQAYEWYIQHAYAAARVLFPQLLTLCAAPADGVLFPDGDAAAVWIASEGQNLVTATVTATELGFPEAAWLLADALRGHHMAHRNIAEWTTVAGAGLDAATFAGDARAQASSLLNLAVMHNCTGDLDAAIDHNRRALRLADTADWPEGQATVLANLGIAYSIQGLSGEAAEHLARSLAINRALGRSVSAAINLNNLGTLNTLTGRIDTAIAYLRESLDLHRAAGGERGQAAALINLGIAHHQLGELDAARACLVEAGRLDRKLGHVDGESAALAHLACVELDAGHTDRVLELARTAAAMIRRASDPYAEAVALNALATAQHQFGNRTVARLHHGRVLRLADSCGSRQPAITALIGIAELDCEAGHLDAAEQHARRAHNLAAEAAYRPLQSRALALLAEINLKRGGPARPVE